MSLLSIDSVSKAFGSGVLWRRTVTHALTDVSIAVEPGETVGVLGESGSGKTTLLRLGAFLIRPDSGAVSVDGRDVWALSSEERRRLRADVQVVFQEGGDAFDPRQNVASAVDEPLANLGASKSDRRLRVAGALESVGLPPELLARFPGELSGGQRQRVGIARALVVEPRLVLLDEPVSALDVSVGAQVLNLLAGLQSQRGLAYVLVSHELPVVRYLAHRAVVLYAGRVVEQGPARSVLDEPAHPYTRALRAAVLTVAPGAGIPDVPGAAPPSETGCPFATRCPEVMPRCRDALPTQYELSDGRSVACHLYESGSLEGDKPWKRSVSMTTS